MTAVTPAPSSPSEQFFALVRDLKAFAPQRLGWGMVMATVAALAEGAGLLLLVPMLGLLGIQGSLERGGAGWLGPYGLESGLAIYVGLVGLAAVILRARGFRAYGN